MNTSWNNAEKSLKETYLQKGEQQSVNFVQSEVMERIRKLPMPRVRTDKKLFPTIELSWYSQVCAYAILTLGFVWGLQTLHKDLQTSIPASFYASRVMVYGE